MAKAKNLQWGSANRPKVSNKLGMPHQKEGSNGDMQVRQTSLGARLFAKIGGRWLSNILHGNDLDNPNVYVPKIWQVRIDVPASEASAGSGTVQKRIYLPEFINQKNFLCANWNIEWLNISGVMTIAEFGLPTHDPNPEGRLDYNPKANFIALKEFNLHTKGFGATYSSASGFAVDTDGDDTYAQIIVTVFFR
jgi:hypothetical protein